MVNLRTNFHHSLSEIDRLQITVARVLNYIDDIVIYGADSDEHDKTLREVMELLKRHNVSLN